MTKRLLLLAATLATLFSPGMAQAQNTTPIDLKTASGFAALAYAGITNTGATKIKGDVGSYPTTTTTGFNQVALTGTNHGGDATTISAVDSLLRAYNAAKGRTATTPLGAVYELGGKKLPPGVYSDPTSFRLSDNLTLTLDAQGDPNAVWIFQAGTAVTTGTNTTVSLINGARSSRVFWQVGSSATLGTYSKFVGTIMAYSSVTLATSAVLDGRALAMHGNVTFQSNTVTVPPALTTRPAEYNLLFKERVMVQTRNAVPTAATNPFDFQIYSPFTRSYVTGPTGKTYALSANTAHNQNEYTSGPVATAALLESTYPNGVYTLSNKIAVNLSGYVYPNISRIVYLNDQSPFWNSQKQMIVNAGGTAKLTWTAFTATNGRYDFKTGGYESIELLGDQDNVYLFKNAFGPAGQASFNTLTLPGNYLTKGHTYTFVINYYLASDVRLADPIAKTSSAGLRTQTYLTISAE